jgi:hypothetical protein
MDVSATYQVTQHQIFRVVRRAGGTRRFNILCVCMLLVGVGSLAVGDQMVGVCAVASSVAVPLLMQLVFRAITRRSAPLLVGPWTVRFTEEGVYQRTSVGEGTVKWEAYASVESWSGFWLLRQRTRVVNFVTQDAFGERERAEITAFLAERFPGGRRR